MSRISKCPKVTVVLTYWEASGEVSEPSYNSLLYSTSVGSYCSKLAMLGVAIVISKSETINDPLTDRGNCQEMLSHLKTRKSWDISFLRHALRWLKKADPAANCTVQHYTQHKQALNKWKVGPGRLPGVNQHIESHAASLECTVAIQPDLASFVCTCQGGPHSCRHGYVRINHKKTGKNMGVRRAFFHRRVTSISIYFRLLCHVGPCLGAMHVCVLTLLLPLRFVTTFFV